MKKLCSMANCANPYSAKGLCKRHYEIVWQAQKRKKLPEHHTYFDMKSRCLNSNHKFYYRYGGRGITVCERWLGIDGFKNFLEDMGRRPIGHSLERINNDGNYEPNNCKWATTLEQGRNKNFKIGTSNEPNITWNKFSNSWLLRIIRNNKLAYSGRFKEIEDAVKMRDIQKAKLDGTTNR